MAYNELIKNFERIRSYMREFYVYGFKSREEYTVKSTRSYDDERRRVESWLGDCMSFHRTPDGKNMFISIDSRVSRHNPLYKALKSKSFTDGDITLHFIIFDILLPNGEAKTLHEITDSIDKNYLSSFSAPRFYDESTVRKKLAEYVKEGIIKTEKKGKTVFYRRAEDTELNCPDVLDFYSEAAPCGVIGSFLLDRTEEHEDHFAFKHHYITQALDSEILCSLFSAMHNKNEVEISNLNRKSEAPVTIRLVPLNIFISVQNGRQYLLGYIRSNRRIRSFRLDYILKVKELGAADDFDTLREKLTGMHKHIWGVSTQGGSERTEHVEFTVHYDPGEEFIYKRLVREKRCGTVEKLDENSCRFTAEVYDSNEMIPWIRTFIGRITDISFSNKEAELRFKNDIRNMYDLYDLNEE